MGGFPDHQGNLISGNQQVALSGGFCGWNSLFGSLGNRGYFSSTDADGWYTYINDPAPPHALCQFKHDMAGIDSPWVGYSVELWKDFYPEFNVAYLKWKWTGIAKEERGL